MSFQNPEGWRSATVATRHEAVAGRIIAPPARVDRARARIVLSMASKSNAVGRRNYERCMMASCKFHLQFAFAHSKAAQLGHRLNEHRASSQSRDRCGVSQSAPPNISASVLSSDNHYLRSSEMPSRTCTAA